MGDIEHNIRIVYKNGYTHDCWVRNLSIQKDTTKIFNWDNADETNKPLDIGVADISSVWIIGVRNTEVTGSVKTRDKEYSNDCVQVQRNEVVKACLKIVKEQSSKYWGNNTDDAICAALNECHDSIKGFFNIE